MVKVVETGYPTGLLVEKGNNGKCSTNWIRNKSIIGCKKDRKWRLVDKSTEYVQD